MPPEPVPWVRKDLAFKDRKHDRIASGDALASGAFAGGGNSTPRWRDPYYFSRASPRRPPPPSHHRPSVSYYQLYDEPNGHGCTPSRSDDGFRSSNGRYGGGGGRSSSRESRGSFRRSPYYDSYQPGHVTSQRSVAVPITSPPPPHPPLKDLNDGGDQRSGRDCDQGQGDRDHSLSSVRWKSSKWIRQGSVSSSKAVRSDGEEAGNGSLEVSEPNLGKETPVRSPVSSPLPSDDGAPKKKQRLTWGQGLAKYEKRKVEGSSANSGKDQVSETSAKVTAMAGSTSPVTPCSAARCSSSGMEDRPFSSINVDTNHCTEISDLGCQICSEELPTVDHLLSVSALTSRLNDLLIPEDVCSGDSTSNRSTVSDKLGLLKADITKELERTECEIDMLENELKSLSSGESVACLISFTVQVDSSSGPPLELVNIASKVSSNSTPITCAATAAMQESAPQHEVEVKHVNNDLSGTASSDNGKSVSSGNAEEVPFKVGEKKISRNVSGRSNNLDVANRNSDGYLVATPYEKTGNNFLALIMASNRDAAKSASQMLDRALPASSPQLNIWGSDRISYCRKNDMHVREKIVLQKYEHKFKERVLALKYRAFHHLWKEDLRLLSFKKHRSKSQKRFELCMRSSQSSSQKHRSSLRSRFTLPAGNTTLVPTADILEFTSKLLSDSQIKFFRNNLRMPALILEEERKYSRFITYNSLVEDPPSFEKEISMINPWTQEEMKVFLEMLATFGKDFAKISSFLTHKTTADCIEFYYRNHKSESFRDVKKQLDLRKQRRGLLSNTYLVPASGKKWNREANAASLDMLGAVSGAAAQNSSNTRSQQKYAGKSVLSSYHSSKVSRGSNTTLISLSNVEEREASAAEMLAGISGALSYEAVNSSSISPSEKMNYVRTGRNFTAGVTQTIEEEDTLSDESCGELYTVDWTDDEKSMFIRALSMYGKEFTRISQCVGTKSRDQCKIFFSKARKCLSLDQVHSGAGDGGTPMSDANGGRSDTDDVCAAEMNSTICSTQSCSKMDVDFSPSMSDANASEAFLQSLQTEIDRSDEQHGVGASGIEEVRGKIEGDISSLNVKKLETDRENSQSDESAKEMADDSSENNNNGPSHDSAELSAHTVLDKVEAAPPISCDEHVKLSSIQCEELKSDTPVEVQQGVISERRLTADEMRNDTVLPQVLALDDGFWEKQKAKVESINTNDPEFSFANGDASCTARKLNGCANPSFSHQHQLPVESLSCSQKNSQPMSSVQDSAYPVPSNTSLPDLSCGNSDGSRRASDINFQDPLHKLHQGSIATDLYQQYFPSISFGQMDPSSLVLSGYPVQTTGQKESKRETNVVCEDQMMHERRLKANASSQRDRLFVPNVYNEKVDGPFTQDRSPELLFSQRNEDTLDSQLRPCSTNSCQETDEQSTQRSGDVKLFGQIITNASHPQKSKSCSQDNSSRPRSPKQKKPAISEASTSRKDSRSSIFLPRSESNGQSGPDEAPLQSYGFWDGNRIQTGFSSLPESAVMQAYKGSVAAAPFYTVKDGVVSLSNGVSTSFQQAHVPPLSANGKRVDSFSELQKRNGFELVSGYQQGGRTAIARLGVNVAGGANRGILVGPSGLSNPVAALKMANLYNGESWMQDLNDR